jgi:peptide/nickel transport system permease protein
MARYIIRRLLYAIPVLIVVSILVFVVVHTTQDPTASFRLNPHVNAADIAREKHALGLDKSGASQYIAWLSHFVRGDWGQSLIAGRPVAADIRTALANTLFLGLIGVIFSLIIGVGIGIVSALKQYSWFDHISTGGAFFGLSMPNFWFALMLQIFFGIYLARWINSGNAVLPTSGLQDPNLIGFHLIDRLRHVILPALVLAVQIIAVYSRFMRASMLDVMHADYIRTARAKGIKESRVVVQHGVRNALFPIVTQFGLDLGSIAGGLIVTETVFNWPGMGAFFIHAMNNGDYPQILPWVMITVGSVIVFNLMVDVAYAVMDPRIRYA